MPGQKISTLTEVNNLQAADNFVLARTGSTYRIAGNKFASKVQLDSLSATATNKFALKTDITSLSSTVDARINSLSSTVDARINSLSSTVDTKFTKLSAAVDAKFIQPPIPIATTTFVITSAYHNRVIRANSGCNTIELPAGLAAGFYVNVYRDSANAALVNFTKPVGVTIRSAPSDLFTKLAFPNSVATAYCLGSNVWVLAGDLIT